MSPAQDHTVQDPSDDNSTELFLAYWLQIMHTSAAAVDEARDACTPGAASDLITVTEVLESAHRVYTTAVLPPFVPVRSDNTCRDCGGQRWLFAVDEGTPDEHSALLTGHRPHCAWFYDLIAKALAEGALDGNGDFVPEAERTA